MMTKVKWLAATCLLATVALTGAGSVDAFGRRDCPPPCPPPPPITVILPVCHPCTGCKLEVPVCIPACVQGVPCSRFERTIIGCGRTVFCWPCGYTVTIRYQRCGDYRVVQRG